MTNNIAKARMQVRAGEIQLTTKEKQEKLRASLMIANKIFITPRIEDLILKLIETKENKETISSALKQEVEKEKQRQHNFLRRLDVEIKNDPQLKDIYEAMKKRPDKLSLNQVESFFKVLKIKYEKKIK